ncbi:hypothetical protein C0995_000592 [Termitomyces sp. Mi166|nr:hypothetical protein C0995_000592 [Termitomyces sp. Mi166\
MSPRFVSVAVPSTEVSDFQTSQSETAAGSSQAVITSEPPTPPEEFEEQEPAWWQAHYFAMAATFNANAGLLLILGSQAFFSMMNVAVKILNSIDPPVPTLELIAVRMFITYIFSLVYMLITKVPDLWFGPKGIRLLLVFRGFSGFFGLFGIYYSLQFLSLSDATVLTFLVPLCTGIAGAMFLKEKYTIGQALASLCSLVGVVLIARPTFLFKEASPSHFIINEYDISSSRDLGKVTSEQRLIAVGPSFMNDASCSSVAMLGVLGATGAYVSITAMGKRAHPMHAMLSFSSQSVIAAVIGMSIQKTPIVIPTKIEWVGMLIMIGVFGFVAQIVFASILERMFFDVESYFLSVTGTFIIITSALYVAMTKRRAQKAMNKRNVRLSGVPERDLEQGLLDGLLGAQSDEQSRPGCEADPGQKSSSKAGDH